MFQPEVISSYLNEICVIFLPITSPLVTLQVCPFPFYFLDVLLWPIIKFPIVILIICTVTRMDTCSGWSQKLPSLPTRNFVSNVNTLPIVFLRPEPFDCPIFDISWHGTFLTTIVQISTNHLRPVHNQSIIIKITTCIEILLLTITL